MNQQLQLQMAVELLEAHRGDGPALTRYAQKMTMSALPAIRQVACALLQDLWVRDKSLTPYVLRLAADADEQVRERSVMMFTSMLITDYPSGIQEIRDLLDHPQAEVLRALAVAVGQAAQYRIPGSAAALLDLLRHAGEDDRSEVQDAVRTAVDLVKKRLDHQVRN
ncbi:hypothetical protein OS242_04055 [Tumebacillus sp. DT12]|uniref:HEAT repeat domain-containing protein n=1 Tax=Tumebacillus lacus TaxID=2995335 RepID=A0ABT3WWS8_9BACL|nr:hypothetical protein [Tumebacillus lacus]MCX7569132.1 hypothetical protein [Tumebacillus lacus]